MEKGVYGVTPVVIKKLYYGTSEDVIRIFMKEAVILSQIKNENVVSIFAVCDSPVSIMMELCEFSFSPFDCGHKVNSLDTLLSFTDKIKKTYFIASQVSETLLLKILQTL